MELRDLYLLSPEISLVGLAGLIVLLDLVVERKGVLATLAVVGLAVPLGLTILLWGEVADWWSLLDNIPGEVKEQSIPGIFSTFSVDRFALFFKLLFITSVGLVLMASVGYVERFRAIRPNIMPSCSSPP